MNLVVLL